MAIPLNNNSLKKHPCLRIGLALCLGILALVTPLDAKKGGNPGGGGSEPPVPFNPVIAYRDDGIMLTDATGANTASLYAGNVYTLDFSPVRPSGDGSGQIAFSETNEATGMQDLRVIEFTFDEVGITSTVVSNPLDSSPGGISDIDYSPDGTAILYKWRGAGEEISDVRTFTSTGVQTIVGDPFGNIYDLAWLPSGRIALGFRQNSIGPAFEDHIDIYDLSEGLALVAKLDSAETEFRLGHYHHIQAAHTRETLLLTANYEYIDYSKGKRGRTVSDVQLVEWVVDTGEIRQLGINGWAGCFSPQDDRVVYQALDQTLNVTEVFLTDAEGYTTGTTEKLTTRHGGILPDWQPPEAQ